MVARPSMLKTHSTEKHSTAVIMSNQPRWGLGTELSWRKQHAGQHVSSAARLRPSTAAPGAASSSRLSGNGPQLTHRSTVDRTHGGDGQPDPFARLLKVGAYTLTREQRAERQRTQIFSVVRRALEEKRQLFGTSVNDTVSLFEAADTDHSGSLDRFEFRRAMRRLGIGLRSAQVDQLVQAVDSDRSGEISYEEFVQAIHEPEPEPEPEAEQHLDAAASMLRDVESSTSGWEHERPWPEAMCPADDAPVDTVVRVVAANGSVMHERQGRPGEVELSRDERNYNAKMAARLSTAGAQSTLRVRITQHSGTNEIGVESADQGKCYGSPGPFWRVEVLGALPVTNIVTRRADGSRPPRMVVREWLKARGWRWNKPGRCWFLDVRHEAHIDVHIERLKLVAAREGLPLVEQE